MIMFFSIAGGMGLRSYTDLVMNGFQESEDAPLLFMPRTRGIACSVDGRSGRPAVGGSSWSCKNRSCLATDGEEDRRELLQGA